MIAFYSILVLVLTTQIHAKAIGWIGHTFLSIHGVEANKPFALSLLCSEAVTFCAATKRAFDRAAQRITNEFKVQQSIKVLVEVIPKCDEEKYQLGCLRKKTTSAHPLALVPVQHQDDNATYMYPTSLLKQLSYAGVDQVVWPEHDIKIRISTNVNWWSPDHNPLIKEDEFDMELEITHELLHGMGFGMGSIHRIKPQYWNGILPLPRFQDAPDLLWALSGPTERTNPIAGWAFPTIWDRFTSLNGVPSTQWRVRMEACLVKHKQSGLPLWMPNNLFDTTSIINDGCTTQIATEAYRLLTSPETLVFDCAAWPSIPSSQRKAILDPGNDEFSWSTVSHLRFFNWAEFLMWFEIKPGYTFQEYITTTGASPSGIGPIAKDIMFAMGYCPAHGECPGRRQLAVVDPSVRGKHFRTK